MVIATDNFRPYASPVNIIAVLTWVRTRNLPNPLNNDFLRIAGVTEASYGRVTQALRFMNLVHEDEKPTDHLMTLASATDAQHRDVLESVVREAYRSKFEFVDSSEDPQSKILDAFQRYEPRSQIGRMVTLFLGLCREAGIPVVDAPKLRQMGDPKPKISRPQNGNRKATQNKSRATQSHDVPTSATSRIFGVT